jgi:hypothetical protein
MDTRWTWAGAGAILIAVIAWLTSSDALEASDVQRRLSDARFEQSPFGMTMPDAWQSELQRAIDRAPEVSLLDPAAPSIAAEVLRSVSWIQPDSVKAELVMPDGIQVEYYPRQARFLLVKAGGAVGVLSADGCLLPEGLPADLKGQLIQVELEAGDVLPAPGRPVASRIAQEALRVFFEVVAIEEAAKLRVKRIRPMTTVAGVIRSTAPGLRLVLDDGRELDWGRSDLSSSANEPPSEEKAARLGSVMRQYPRLAGVQAVVLYHQTETLVLDNKYQQLPFDGVVLKPR